jgi:ABC-type nickel/cobalt efflux system permease component RcnA
VNPPPEGVLDVRMTEIALFVGGAVVTVMVLALGIWLFVRASREEAAREESERRERESHEGEAHEGEAHEAESREKRGGDAA